MTYKVFTDGAALTATDLNNYLMRQSIISVANAAGRDALATPQAGMQVYRVDTDVIERYVGGAWKELRTTTTTNFSYAGVLPVVTGLGRYYVPVAGAISLVNASIGAGTSATVVVRKNGTAAYTLSLTGTAVTTSTTAVAVAAGDYLTVDITAISGAYDLGVLVRILE